MLIKDLEMSKELNGEELSAVRGGTAITTAGIIGPVLNGNGSLIDLQVAPIIVNQIALDFNIDVSNVTATAIAAGLGNSVNQAAFK